MDEERCHTSNPLSCPDRALARDGDCSRAKIPVNIWYVLDDSVLGSESFEPSQAEYVAIGTVKVSGRPFWWLRLWSALS